MKRNKKRLLIAVCILIGICVAVIGVQGKKRTSTKKWSMVYIPKAEDGINDFWTSLISGTRMAAKEYGVELTVEAPATEQDMEQQIRILEEAIEQNPSAILISPSSFTESEELIREANAKGILVGYIDSYTEDEIQDFLVATDNLEVGRRLGEYVAGMVDEDTQIAMVSHIKGVSSAVEREQGFREGLGEAEDQIMEVVFCDSLFDKSYELTMELIDKYPNLEIIAGTNEDSTVGAARAIADAGMQDRIKVVGVDSSIEAVGFMEQGVIKALVVQKAFRMGYLGVEQAVRMLNGEKIESFQDSGCELVTMNNLYDSEIEKLIFPFTSGES